MGRPMMNASMKGDTTMAEKTVPTIQKESEPTVKREITRNTERYVSPLVDIFETANGLTVVVDLPGVEKDGLDIKVEDGILTIEGRMKTAGRNNSILSEFAPVNFFRQFELSEVVEIDKIAATLTNGVLTLDLPKPEAQKPRQITVKVG